MSRETLAAALALFEAGDFDGAEILLDQMPALDPGDDEADRLELCGRIAVMRRAPEEAVALLERALAVRVKLHGATSEAAAAGHGALTRHHLFVGDTAAAVRTAKHAVRASRDDAGWLVELGDAERVHGDATTAEQTYLRALKKLRGAERQDAVVGLGNIHLLHGNGKRARKRFEEALALVDDHESYVAGEIFGSLGEAATALGETETAVEYLERSLKILLATAGEVNTSVAVCLNNLAIAWAPEDSYQAAAAMQYSLAVGERAYPPDHPVQATGFGNLAYFCSEVGQPVTAIAHAERALAIHEKQGPWSLDIALTLSNLANYHREAGHTDRAVSIAGRLASQLAALVQTGQEHAAGILFSTGTILLELAKDALRALELYGAAVKLRERLRDSDDEVVLSSARNAAARLFEAGATAQAIELLNAAKRRWKDPDHLAAIAGKLVALRAGDRDAVLEDTELEESDEDDDD